MASIVLIVPIVPIALMSPFVDPQKHHKSRKIKEISLKMRAVSKKITIFAVAKIRDERDIPAKLSAAPGSLTR